MSTVTVTVMDLFGRGDGSLGSPKMAVPRYSTMRQLLIKNAENKINTLRESGNAKVFDYKNGPLLQIEHDEPGKPARIVTQFYGDQEVIKKLHDLFTQA